MTAARRVRAGRLIIVCGLPGAGKTTLARELEHDLLGVRLCPDEWMADLGIDLFDSSLRDRVEKLQWQHAQRLLRLGQVVIIEWGTWRRTERDGLRQETRSLGASVELRYLDAPLDVLWSRVRGRDAERSRQHRALTRDDIEAYSTVFERPDAEELSFFDSPVDPPNLYLARRS